MDRVDLELMKSVYHPGAIDHHGPFDMPGTEFCDMVHKVIDVTPGAQQHHIISVLIDVDGDTARAESYYSAYLSMPVGRAPGDIEGVKPSDWRLMTGAGRYIDEFAHRDGR